MLKTPSSDQPCSSSPMRWRLGSAESVVLPVPERPKKTVTLLLSSTFAEQCIDRTLSSGRRSFISVKIDFLIDAAPPDPVFGAGLADDEFVLRRPPRLAASVDDERTAFGQTPVSAQDRVRVQKRRRRLHMDAAACFDAVGAQIRSAFGSD